MNKELIAGVAGTALTAAGTASTNEVLETISLILTIIGAVITLIVVPLLNWYNRVKADGKITKEEIKEGIEIISEGTKEVADKIDDKK